MDEKLLSGLTNEPQPEGGSSGRSCVLAWDSVTDGRIELSNSAGGTPGAHRFSQSVACVPLRQFVLSEQGRMTGSGENCSRYTKMNPATDVLRFGFEEGYSSIYRALDFMSSRLPGEDMYINEDTRRTGANVLGLLSLFDIRAPKVFTHDEDAVVFTWNNQGREYLLTVGEGSASLLRTNGSDATVLAQAELTNGSVIELINDVGENVGRRNESIVR